MPGSLESDLIEFVVLKHFAFLAQHPINHNPMSSSLLPSSASSQMAAQEALMHYHAQQKNRQRRLYWKQITDSILSMSATLFGMGLSYVISRAMEKRLQGGYGR